MRDTEREREAETQAEGEEGALQGARCGTRSRDPRVMPWAKGGAKPLSHPGCDIYIYFKDFTYLRESVHKLGEGQREREKRNPR